MNERIKELVEQCTEVDSVGIDETFHYRYDLEKFAELIVRECLGIVDDEGCGEGGSIRSMEKIKQHFGVEE